MHAFLGPLWVMTTMLWPTVIGVDTEYPLAGLPIQYVLGASPFRVAQKQERSSLINPRVVMVSGWEAPKGLSPFPSHDYPEY